MNKTNNIILLREREREQKISNKKKVIWALYDDAQMCYKKSINSFFSKKDVLVISIGINNKKIKNYERVDLSVSNPNLLNDLLKIEKKYGKPEIVLASPPCECWSGADCNGRIWKSICCTKNKQVTKIEIKNNFFYGNYNKRCYKNKRRDYYKKTAGMLNGIGTITATIWVIDFFKPKNWVIENPKTSMIWKWITSNFDTKSHFFNSSNYACYDNNFSLKPTTFYSNKSLKLKSNHITGNKKHMSYGSYSRRSSIPSLLIKDIVNQLLNKG